MWDETFSGVVAVRWAHFVMEWACAVDAELSTSSLLNLTVWDKDGDEREFLGSVDVPMTPVICLLAYPNKMHNGYSKIAMVDVWWYLPLLSFSLPHCRGS